MTSNLNLQVTLLSVMADEKIAVSYNTVHKEKK